MTVGLAVAVLLGSLSWAEPDRVRAASIEETAAVGAFQITLAGCELTYRGRGTTGRVEFDFPAPCRFNRTRRGDIRIVKTRHGHTLAVEASRPSPVPGPGGSRDCETYIRGVVVGPRHVRLSVQTQKVAQCLPVEWDDTMFHAFGARTQPLTPEPSPR